MYTALHVGQRKCSSMSTRTLQKRFNAERAAPSGFIQLLFMYCLICGNLKTLFSVSLVFVITILVCVCVCNCLVRVVPRDLWNALFRAGTGGEYRCHPFTVNQCFPKPNHRELNRWRAFLTRVKSVVNNENTIGYRMKLGVMQYNGKRRTGQCSIQALQRVCRPEKHLALCKKWKKNKENGSLVFFPWIKWLSAW